MFTFRVKVVPKSWMPGLDRLLTIERKITMPTNDPKLAAEQILKDLPEWKEYKVTLE